MFLCLNKKTNTADIFGSISAIIKNDSLQKTKYPNKFYHIFSRKRKDIFEDENYRIEKKELITASRKKK